MFCVFAYREISGMSSAAKPGVTIERAQADMNTIAGRLAQEYKEDAGVTSYLVPAAQQITGSVRPALLVLLGAVSFVLLIGCANLANLLMARSAANTIRSTTPLKMTAFRR